MRSEVDDLSRRISGEELKKELIAFARELGFRFVPCCRLRSPAPCNRVSKLAAGRGGRRNALHGAQRRETLRSAEGFTGRAVDHCCGVELFPGSIRFGASQTARYRRNRAVRVGRRLSRRDRGKAGQDRQFPWWIRRTAKMLRRYRPDSGTRSRSAGRDRLARQKHNANRSAPGHVVFSRRDFNNARSTSG